MDLSGITSYKTINTDDIKDSDLNELGDQLNRLVSRPITKFESEQVYLIIKKLEEFTPISYEFISYLLVTSQLNKHKDTIDRIGSVHFKKEVKGRLNKIKEILKSRSKVIVSNKNKYTKYITSICGSLQTERGRKIFHYIKLIN